MFSVISNSRTPSRASTSCLSMDLSEDDELRENSPLALLQRVKEFGQSYFEQLARHTSSAAAFCDVSLNLRTFTEIVRQSPRVHDDFIIHQLEDWVTQKGLSVEEEGYRRQARYVILQFFKNGDNYFRLNSFEIKNLPDALFAHSAFQKTENIAMIMTSLDKYPLTLGCLEDSLRKVYLRRSDLVQFPILLTQLSLLQELDISGNKLSGSPWFLHDFPRLVRVDLSANNFTEIPDISGLRLLEKITACNNRIAIVHPGINSCTQLRDIIFSANMIEEMPNLDGLLNLKNLFLQQNRLRSLGTLPENLLVIDISTNPPLITNENFIPLGCQLIQNIGNQ